MPKLTASQQAAVDRCATDRRELANFLTPLLSVDGQLLEGPDVRDLVAGGSDGRVVEATDSEPGVQLSALIATRLDLSLEGKEVRMDFDVDGETLPGFQGYLGYPKHTGASTQIEAYTTAYEWPETPLGQNTEYVNAKADGVAFSALSVLSNRYRAIELPPAISEPRVTLQGSDRLTRSDKVSDVMDLLEGDEETQTRRFLDTATNTATAYPLTPITQATQTVWEIEEGEDCDIGAVEVEPVFEKSYFAVEVHRTDEAGVTTVLARRTIDNGTKNVPASRVYVIEWENDSDQPTVDKENAHQIAFNEAMRRGKDAVKVTAPVCYWPFWIERGEFVGVTTVEYTGQTPEAAGERGKISRRYVFRTDGFRWGPSRSEGQLSGEGLLVDRRFVASEERRERARVPVGELFGYDFATSPFFYSEVPWVNYIAEDGAVELDTEIAAEYGVNITTVTEGSNKYVEVTG